MNVDDPQSLLLQDYYYTYNISSALIFCFVFSFAEVFQVCWAPDREYITATRFGWTPNILCSNACEFLFPFPFMISSKMSET